MKGHIFQLNCSPGGVPKLAVREAVLTPTGLSGDAQANRDHHGGPERALCLFPLEFILRFQAEGHPIFPGSVGENLTLAGLDWIRLTPGRRLVLGESVVIELSSYANPCRKIAASFADGEFTRISAKVNPGNSRVYARVLQPGRLAIGQLVTLLDENND